MKKSRITIVCLVGAICLSGCGTTPTPETPSVPSPTVSDLAVIAGSTPEEASQSSTITLTAGEENEYAELFTLNAGTEFEETQYVYYLPVGTYTAKNVSNYPAQINVYSRETHITEEGWEEPSESIFAKLLQVGESTEITISEDQYIEIHEPDVIELQKIDSDEPAEQESVVPHREGEEIVGVSDKKLDDVNVLFDESVRNDVTGNWRLAKIAENNFDIAEYAVDYYNKYFKADNEVHAIVNFTTNTTTKINASTGMLFVTVYEYLFNTFFMMYLLYTVFTKFSTKNPCRCYQHRQGKKYKRKERYYESCPNVYCITYFRIMQDENIALKTLVYAPQIHENAY